MKNNFVKEVVVSLVLVVLVVLTVLLLNPFNFLDAGNDGEGDSRW